MTRNGVQLTSTCAFSSSFLVALVGVRDDFNVFFSRDEFVYSSFDRFLKKFWPSYIFIYWLVRFYNEFSSHITFVYLVFPYLLTILIVLSLEKEQ